MQTIKLTNGVEMPLLGYGVFKVAPQECERCVSDALSVGYRLIDTAQAYFNEEGVGNAVSKSGIPRQDIFLVTKVWISNAGEEKAAASIDESLRPTTSTCCSSIRHTATCSAHGGRWRKPTARARCAPSG